MRHFLHIAYKGTNYKGWQRQTSAISIQQVIEEQLQIMLHSPERVIIHGCGRTDGGVHADQYFFHFDVKEEWDFDFVFRLNKMLPDDIAVFDVFPVAHNANAQYNAIKRTYNYFIHFYKEPFLNESSTLYQGGELDLKKMAQALNILTKYTDFRALCKSPDKVNHTRCNLSAAQLFVHKKGNRLRLEITSNRFLRGMIRLIVANLLEIGQGRLSLNDWEAFIAKAENPNYKKLAPPQGLHLSKVVYPYLDVEVKEAYLNWDKVDG